MHTKSVQKNLNRWGKVCPPALWALRKFSLSVLLDTVAKISSLTPRLTPKIIIASLVRDQGEILAQRYNC